MTKYGSSPRKGIRHFRLYENHPLQGGDRTMLHADKYGNAVILIIFVFNSWLVYHLPSGTLDSFDSDGLRIRKGRGFSLSSITNAINRPAANVTQDA